MALADAAPDANGCRRVALGPRRRGSRADRARVVAGALAQPRAGAGIDRRAAARESGGRRDPARTIGAAGRARRRSPRSASRAPRPRRGHPGDAAVFPCRRRQRADDSGVAPAGSADRARARRAADPGGRVERVAGARQRATRRRRSVRRPDRRGAARHATHRRRSPPNPSSKENPDVCFARPVLLSLALLLVASPVAGAQEARRPHRVRPMPTPPAAERWQVDLRAQRARRRDGHAEGRPTSRWPRSLSLVAGGRETGAGPRRHRDARRDRVRSGHCRRACSYRDVGINVDAAPQHPAPRQGLGVD